LAAWAALKAHLQMHLLRLFNILTACPTEFIPFIHIARKGDLYEFNCPHPFRNKIFAVAATLEVGIETLTDKVISEIKAEIKLIEDRLVIEKEKLEKLLNIIEEIKDNK
jgi:hypothetical protein